MQTCSRQMIFATSLSPRRLERQAKCISSWQRYGYRVLAVQTAGEVERLSKWFPSVEFAAAQPIESVFDKPYLPSVYSIMDAASFDCLLINADIELTDETSDFAAMWQPSHDKELVMGLRHDYRAKCKPVLTPYGIDAFRIMPNMKEHLAEDGFCIGMPGWDYWIPWKLWAAGFSVRVSQSVMLHELHEMGWDDDSHGVAGRELLAKTCRMPTGVFTPFIQWITGRENMRRTTTAKKSRRAMR